MLRLCRWLPLSAALANDGVRVAPHLIREIRNSAGTSDLSTKP